MADDEYINKDAVFGVGELLLVSPKQIDSVAEAARYNVKQGVRLIEFDVGVQPIDEGLSHGTSVA